MAGEKVISKVFHYYIYLLFFFFYLRLFSQVVGVWNVSNSQGHLGTLHSTNIRVVWHANATPSFNVSIPYLQMINIQLRQGKSNDSLIIETNKYSNCICFELFHFLL